MLLGCTHDSVRTLDVIHDADLTARLLGQEAQQRPDSHTAEFTRCLEHEANTYDREQAALDETPGPEESRLLAIKEKLTGTIQRLRATAVAR